MNKDLLKSMLQPCLMEEPYIFISYSSRDWQMVWPDVIELQKRGWNVWIDEPNLDRTQKGWEQDALAAIEDRNARLMLFYVSQASLTSPNCFQELSRTESARTRQMHRGTLPFIAVEAEPITHMKDFMDHIQNQLDSCSLSKEGKDAAMEALGSFSATYFPDDNRRVRMHVRTDYRQEELYYADLERQLERNPSRLRLPAGILKQRMEDSALYDTAFVSLLAGKEDYACEILEAIQEDCVPAALLLGHLYWAGDAAENQKAREIWIHASRILPVDTWMENARQLDAQKFYSLAAAFYSAYGEATQNIQALLRAGQEWMKLGSKSRMILVMEEAKNLGSRDARKFLERYRPMSEENIRDFSLQQFADARPACECS